MSAKVPANASYTWRSLMAARDLVAKGDRKLIGTGSNIDVWKDLWVPSLPNFRPPISDGEWNLNVLKSHFLEWEVNEVLKIPIPRFGEIDSWTWHFTKSGDFSVRSAYHAALGATNENSISSSSLNHDTTLSYLWAAKLPPKIKHFGWRALRNALPVRSNLKKRGICADDTCPMCGDAPEMIGHACFFFLQCCEDIVSLLWGIWLRGNAWTFENKDVHIVDVLRKAAGIIGEYDKANAISPYDISIRPEVPKSVDIGVGGIARDSVGDIMLAVCNRKRGCPGVDSAEAIAARDCLGIALEAGLNKIILESDSFKLVQHLKGRKQEPSYFGLIVADILKLAEACSFFGVFILEDMGMELLIN
uniref:Reverse transcriptase zinc-binding domain-containing protein n=1 Tax=Chenopodium quinoa TaxID=63459 RepID=A0A803LLX0_CHEQI